MNVNFFKVKTMIMSKVTTQLGMAAQVLVSLILPVKDKGSASSKCILEVNIWLCRWCHQQGFDLNHGVVFQEDGLLGGAPSNIGLLTL